MSKLLNELKHFRTDVEAYQLYLRGRFLFNRFIEADLRKALACFEEAIDHDPNLAEAYSGIADVYMWLTELGPITPREGMPKAKAAALKAIELDPQLSEAHTSYAIVLQEFDYDFAQAETEYKRAIELNPNNALAHQMYGALLAQLDQVVTAYEDQSQRKLDRLRQAQIIFVAAACLLLVWGYFIVHRHIIQPITRLSLTAQKIGAGELQPAIALCSQR